MKRLAILFTILMLYVAVTFYLGFNINLWFQEINLYVHPLIYWFIIYFISFSIILGRLHKSLRALLVIGNYWMFVIQYGLILCIFANLTFLITPFKNIALIGTIATILFIVLFIIGKYNAYSPIVKNIEITIDKKGDPLRIAVGSDFHLGVLSNKTHLKKFVHLSNNAHPDIVLLVGDIVDDDPLWFVAYGMADVIKQLKSTYGVYGVLGNHEYYGGKIPLFINEMREAGVKILLDETIKIGDMFYLTGQEDLTNKHRLSLESLKPDNTELPWFVMNHTPDDLDTPTKLGVDLHLSGHTHKGQMWPGNLITKRIFELDYGYKLKKQMHTVVTSGFGFWGPPTRIGTRAEMWIIDVKFTK